MGQHPNGNGQHFHQAPHWPPPHYAYPPPQAAPGGNGFSITKGYINIGLMCSIVCIVAVGTWTVSTAWNDQKSAVQQVQKDVDKLSVGHDLLITKTGKIEQGITEIKSALEQRSPWQGEVRAAVKR